LIHVPVIVSSVDPAADIGFRGGQDLIISGDNFGNDPSVVSVIFEDGTTCDVKEVEMEKISCTTNKFTVQATTQPKQKVTVTVNEKAKDAS
jgi:hypothetical protein